ncbi:MAG TPA: class I adenylate-forming enzyme family protein [Planctomycetota bacterium]|nr:class I adenylate-forming enzyme family protein [Planctomycetota bacterium]
MVRSPFGDFLARQAREQGGREAVRSEGERASVSFAGLHERSGVWERGLEKAGVEAGRLVALATGNTLAFVELFFALRRRGAAVLIVDDGHAAPGTLEVCRAMGAAGILHRQSSIAGVGLAGAPDPSVRWTELPGSAPPPGTAIVKLTSGSTLNPRGACFTEEALLEGIDHIVRGMSLTPRDRVLVSIPLGHSYGFDNGVLSLAAAGTPLVLQPDVLPTALLGTIRDRGITFFPAVPALLRALALAEWPRDLPLRSVISASAPMPAETEEAFRVASGLRIQQFFGATEAGGISFETRPDEPHARGSVGFPLPGVRIELHPEDGIRVHSAANRFAILPSREATPPHVATGDRGEISPDGRLRLKGRIQVVGNIGGIKVDVGAIDEFLRTLPGVGEAAVLPVEDPVRGHRLVACVESDTQSPNSLLELCRARLSAREVPSEIRVVDRLPRTSRGKLDRSALRDMLVVGP